MIDSTYEQVVKAVHKLRPEQKAALLETLQKDPPIRITTRSQLLAELEALRAMGAFDQVESLRNRFASPALNYVTDEQLLSVIHESASEWEGTLDELADRAGAEDQPGIGF